MSKRISDLTTSSSPTTSYVLEVDEPSGSIAETEKLTLTELITLGSILTSASPTSITVTDNVSGSLTNQSSHYLIRGKIVFISIVFDWAASATDPVFSTGVVPSSSIKDDSVLTCAINGANYECLVTSRTPLKFTVKGTFASGTTRNVNISGALMII